MHKRQRSIIYGPVGSLLGCLLVLTLWQNYRGQERLTAGLSDRKLPLLETASRPPKNGPRESADVSAGGVAANGQLSVKDGRLVNRHGQPVQLRGMSSHGLMWYPAYVNAQAMLTIKKRGANLFRAAMYTDHDSGGYNGGDRARIFNKLMMFMAVENALACDMYIIVDWHLLKEENPLKTVDSAVSFFDEMAYRYRHEPGVIFEICNEPNGPTTWDDIRAYADQVIPVIRKHSPKAVIVVGTPEFSSDLRSVRRAPLSHNGVMYAYHFYTGHKKYYYKEEITAMLEAGLPVFVSEWGVGPDPDTGRPDVEEVPAFLDFLKRHKISWANWSLSNTDEASSAIKANVIDLSGWKPEDLTLSGTIVFDAFKD